MEKKYHIQFTCGYSCMVVALCVDDALALAKAYAIEKGYSQPIPESIRFAEKPGPSAKWYTGAIPNHVFG